MYDELIRNLRNESKYALPSQTRKALIEAADAIEELTRDLDSMNEANIALYGALPKWIPVTERLPDAGERALCYCRANIYEVMKMRTDGAWVHNDIYDSTYMSGFVTHWMPLPSTEGLNET